MRISRHTAIAITCLLLAASPALAQRGRRGGGATPAEAQPTREAQPPGRGGQGQTQPPQGDGERPRNEGTEAAVERSSVTEHEITVHGQTLRYRATAGTLVLRNDEGRPRGDIFYVAYEKLSPKPAQGAAANAKHEEGEHADADGTVSPAATRPQTRPAGAGRGTGIDPATRPITYVFNGGPGAAAVWLHLGTVGPKRVKLTEAGEVPPPPYALEDNPATWLDLTDLVFIDPVGTGYSRPAPGEQQAQFSGVQEDVQAVGEFIRLWTTRNQRWASAKFLAGESYGTTRAAALSDYLLNRLGIGINGITFVSTVLNFQTIRMGAGNDLPFVLYLPTYTATAGYFKKLPPDLQADQSKALREAERWAVESYLPALARGHALGDTERADVAQKLARFTGLSAEVVQKANLRIDPGFFRKALLEDQRLVLGRYDARLSGYNVDPLEKEADWDPSFNTFLAAYTAAFNSYVRDSLHFESDRQYEVLSPRVGQWNYGRAGGGYLDVADNLQNAMRQNPHLKVLFASGLYDLATPYFGTNYTVDHLELPPDLRKNVAQTFYPDGHMLYHHRPSAEQLHRDVAAFMGRAMPAQATPVAADGRQQGS